MDGSPFQLAHADFNERPDAVDVRGDFLNLLRLGLPRSWRLEVAGWWTHAHPRELGLPAQGFKIHLSSKLPSAAELLRRVLPVLIRHRAAFKVVSGPELLAMALSKNFGRGASGKFITVYPNDTVHFRRLLEDVHAVSCEFEGPYILSDMRYADSRVLYYRYGAFRGESRLRPDGTEEDLMRLPDGTLVEDRRLPYYRLPEGIIEPFERPSDISQLQIPLLDERFKVQRALKFSNFGGVYLALDIETGEEVILKESRPGMGLVDAGEGRYLDAQALLSREFAVLEQAVSSGRTPRPIRLFEQGGHRYIAISRLPGQVLRSFRARDDVLLQACTTVEEVNAFVKSFVRLARELISAIAAVHECGIALCDFSPSNVLVDLRDDGSLGLGLIDFESSWLEAWGEPDYLALHWGTPGYRRPRRKQLGATSAALRQHDWYSVAMSLYSCLLPNNALFELDADKFEPMVQLVCERYGLPVPMREFLQALREANLDEADAALSALSQPECRAQLPLRPFATAESRTRLSAQIGMVRGEMQDYLFATMDDTREDRLWPSSSEVFATHPLALAHGAAGIVAYLLDSDAEMPANLRYWWDQQTDGPANLPPGLFSGSAGVALVCQLLGDGKRAERLLRQSAMHPLRDADPSWFYGEAGLGHAALAMHALCGEAWMLELADDCAQRLARKAIHVESGCLWLRGSDTTGRPGFALGAAGVCLFLAQYAQRASADEVGQLALRGARFVVASAHEERGRPVWYADDSRSVHTPYQFAGSAGIGSALLRVAALLGDESLRAMALRACDAAYSPLVVGSDLFQGMAGIGEAQVDAYLSSGQEQYLDRAYELADAILRCQVKRSAGVAQPGVSNSRIQCDLAGGAAGVGYFLMRLQRLGSRRFMDLPELLPQRAKQQLEVSVREVC